MNPLIIHHGSCPDGYGAAWWLAKNIDGYPVFHEGFYGEDPPYDLAAGRDVWIVDFSYPGEQLDRLANVCKNLIVFDHHQSAIANLAASKEITTFESMADWEKRAPELSRTAVLDMNRSGIGLVCEWVARVHGEPSPDFLFRLEDRDLWRFEIPDTRDVFAAVTSRPYDAKVWDEVRRTPLSELITEGQAINRWRDQLIEQVASSPFTVWLDDIEIACASSPYAIGSDVAGLLAERHGGIGAYCILHEEDVQIGLRSRSDGPDVAAIAEKYGGGGHRSASGLRVTWQQWARLTCTAPIG